MDTPHLLTQGGGLCHQVTLLLFVTFLLSLIVWNPGEGKDKKEPLPNWLRATTHTTRCPQSAIYFVIKVPSPHRKAEHWVSVLPLKKGVWGECWHEKGLVGLWCRV